MAHVSALMIVDPEQGKVVWAHTGDFKGQHDPTIVADGRILLFDNEMTPWGVTAVVDLDAVGESRVIEFDPETGRTAWEFHGSPSSPFFSHACGTAQRLANGNTLVTESDSGRAFELTQDKRVVWEFYNPHRAGEHNEFVATLFELVRLPPEFPTPWISASLGARSAIR
jgi:outer membrane protein assembly factor BamB